MLEVVASAVEKSFEKAAIDISQRLLIEAKDMIKDIWPQTDTAIYVSEKINTPADIAKETWNNTIQESTLYKPKKESQPDGDHYYDDYGNEYRINNNLTPNNTYEINGYSYQTDNMGRIKSVEGQLHIKTREGRLPIRDLIEDIGKGNELKTDHRGHLVGDQFDGTNGLENMIPQDANINRGSYNKFECQLATEVKEGKVVEVDIEVNYDVESRRPTELIVMYTIDGITDIKIFPNVKE